MPAVTVIGAGPYGLATAAHLRAAGVEVRVFGDPMSFWSQNMPAGMLLRSPRVASSISDPHGKLDLDGYSAATGNGVGSPVPLASFVEYGRWFQSTVVPDLDERRVESIRTADGGFRLQLSGGEEATASRVVVAAGIGPFPHVPAVFRDLPRTHVSHASDHRHLSQFRGRRVLVVGGGQSALESAALLHEVGAETELAMRAPAVHWLGQRPWLRSMGPLSTLLYAPPEVGPPLVSQLVRSPGAMRRLPSRVRHAVDHRSIRPAGAGWLKPRVDGVVPLTARRTVTEAKPDGDDVAVRFADGTQALYGHVLLGTGYRVDIARYSFLPPELVGAIRQVNGYPVLGRGFASSVPGLHFVGAPGAWSFGPLMRFVAGTPFAAAEVARFVTARTRRIPARPTAVQT
jgi:cation diffusion facilitator CzcD-associated flavoprotein CzcO